MSHTHSVIDTDKHFVIDPATRQIAKETAEPIVLVQNDHNSERLTFEIPRYHDGHDMSECNLVQVHYMNIEAAENTYSATKTVSKGVYTVDDLQISPEDENKVIVSWLISRNATKYKGPLHFLLSFQCTAEGTVVYAWNTELNTEQTVSIGLCNSDEIIDEHIDLLEQWKAEIWAAINETNSRVYAVEALVNDIDTLIDESGVLNDEAD